MEMNIHVNCNNKKIIYQSILSYTIMLITLHQRKKIKSKVFKKYLQ